MLKTVARLLFSILKWFTLGLLSLIVLICIAEFIARFLEKKGVVPFAYPEPIVKPESHLFVPDTKHPGFMVTDPNKAHRDFPPMLRIACFFEQGDFVPFRSESFRKDKPAKTFRIFFVGESTVNRAYWEIAAMVRHLRKRFPEFDTVEVINAGGCSYGSSRLVYVLAEALQYDPDGILLYVGQNEFEEEEQFHYADPNSPPVHEMLSRPGTVRSLSDRLALFQLLDVYNARNTEIMAIQEKRGILRWDINTRHLTRDQVLERMEAYRNNLELMVQMTRACGVPLVMGSIPSNLVEPHLISPDRERYAVEVLAKFKAGDYDGGKKAAQEILKWATRHQSSDLENERLRAVAQKWNVPFVDVEAKFAEVEPHHVPGETLIGDHCHLNGRGNRVMVGEFEKKAVEMIEAAKSKPRAN